MKLNRHGFPILQWSKPPKTEPIEYGNRAARVIVFNQFGGRCAYCGWILSFAVFTIDHILPKNLGGTDKLDNLFPSCRTCNHLKRNNRLEKFRDEFTKETGRNKFYYEVCAK